MRAAGNARLWRATRPAPAVLSAGPAAAGLPAEAASEALPSPGIASTPVITPVVHAAPVATAAPPPADAVGVSELGAILARRWFIVLASTLLMTLLATLAAFLVSSKYTASTSIFIDPRTAPAFQTDNLAAAGSFDPNLVDSLTMVIESETVLRRVVTREGLAQDPEFNVGGGDAATNALLNFKEVVKVKRPERTYVVEVQVRTKDPRKSARLANAIARAYLNDGSDAKTDTVTREKSWLDKHLDQLEKRLREAEARVADYKTRNRLFGAEGRLVGEQQLSDINKALGEGQKKAAEAKATLDQVEALRRSGRLPDATTEALKSGVIERLRTQQAEILRLEANTRSTLGPRHPAAIEVREQLSEVQRQINLELARIAENARSSYAVARANVQQLERELDRLRKSESDTGQTLLGLRELERAVEAQRTVYEKFLRDKEAIARLSVDTPAGRVIQVAEVPLKASFPNRPLFMALGAVAGLFLGVGLALLVEAFARRVPVGTGAATLAALSAYAPLAPSGSAPPVMALPPAGRRGMLGLGGRPDPLTALLAAPEGAYATAVAALADRLFPAEGQHSLAVSNTGAGAPNAALVLALALALTRQGRAVLMVDAHGGAGSLSERLAAGATPVELLVAGRRQIALRLPVKLPGALYLMGPGLAAPASAPSAGSVAITLIDGPGLKDEAFEALEIGGAVQGVLAVLPPGTRRPSGLLMKRLSQRLGSACRGVIAEGA